MPSHDAMRGANGFEQLSNTGNRRDFDCARDRRTLGAQAILGLRVEGIGMIRRIQVAS